MQAGRMHIKLGKAHKRDMMPAMQMDGLQKYPMLQDIHDQKNTGKWYQWAFSAWCIGGGVSLFAYLQWIHVWQWYGLPDQCVQPNPWQRLAKPFCADMAHAPQLCFEQDLSIHTELTLKHLNNSVVYLTPLSCAPHFPAAVIFSLHDFSDSCFFCF